MIALFSDLGRALLDTARDILPIVVVLGVFQALVIRKPVLQLRRVLVGAVFVLVGLTLFLIGLEGALFPLGEAMARQLTNAEFVFGSTDVPPSASWLAYAWVYVFAALLGFATTIAEPALIAVALKAEEVSRGNVKQGGLRIAVAIGVGVGVMIGTIRIVVGAPLHVMMAVGYLLVIVQTAFAPRPLVPLAYDSGGVTTSTVTVPLVAALGLGLAATIPGRNPAIDGFGLIAFASLFPMMAVMGYAQLIAFRHHRQRRRLARAPSSGGAETSIEGGSPR